MAQTKEERAAQKKAYREAHREEIAAYKKAFRAANRERIAAQKKAHDLAHREEIAAYNKAYRAAHIDQEAAKDAAYYATHKAQKAARDRARRAANRERITKQERAYRIAHPEKRAEWKRAWDAAHPDKARAARQTRQLRLRSNGGTHTTDEWRALCDWFGNVCLCCGASEGLSEDHVIPIAKGGTNSISNIQPLCRTCNLEKHRNEIDYRNPTQMAAFLAQRTAPLGGGDIAPGTPITNPNE